MTYYQLSGMSYDTTSTLILKDTLTLVANTDTATVSDNLKPSHTKRVADLNTVKYVSDVAVTHLVARASLQSTLEHHI